MSADLTCPIAIRSYDRAGPAHSHAFSQLVLPLEGRLAIDIAGRGAMLDRGVAAYVDAGLPHAQEGVAANRSLILDLDRAALDARAADRFAARPFLALTPPAASLIDYMGLSIAGGTLAPHRVRLWMPLLFDALLGDGPRPQSRLAGLVAAIEAAPALDWTVTRMAAKVGVSASRLHAIFLDELGQSPHAWLSHLRLERVRHGLAATDLPIAELAYRAGYADQSALTRAVRKATGLTPSAYRRRARDSA